MSTNQIERQIDELLRLEAEIDELKKQAEEIKSSVKEQMQNDNVEVYQTPKYLIRWVEVISKRLDSKKVRALLGDEIWNELSQNVISRKWTVSC